MLSFFCGRGFDCIISFVLKASYFLYAFLKELLQIAMDAANCNGGPDYWVRVYLLKTQIVLLNTIYHQFTLYLNKINKAKKKHAVGSKVEP